MLQVKVSNLETVSSKGDVSVSDCTDGIFTNPQSQTISVKAQSDTIIMFMLYSLITVGNQNTCVLTLTSSIGEFLDARTFSFSTSDLVTVSTQEASPVVPTELPTVLSEEDHSLTCEACLEQNIFSMYPCFTQRGCVAKLAWAITVPVVAVVVLVSIVKTCWPCRALNWLAKKGVEKMNE
jgi:hypothetical protein